MNAKESKNTRLDRIKTVSRIVRYVILGFFVVTVWFWLTPFFNHVSLPLRWTANGLTHSLLDFSLVGVLCFWYWKLAKLFQFYERGLIFATETIHCIQTLGLLCVINWLLFLVLNMVNRWFPTPPAPPPLPPGVKLLAIKSTFKMGFFSFSIYGINLGMLLAGIIIVITAWIMNEGRKIQEEQELTV